MRRPGTIPVWAVLLAGVVLSGSAVAVPILSLSLNPIDGGSGAVHNSTALVIDSQQLTYTGENVSGMTIVVNNTGTSDLSGDVTVVLRTIDGSVIERKTQTGTVFSSSDSTTVILTFDSAHPVGSFSLTKVTVERTS